MRVRSSGRPPALKLWRASSPVEADGGEGWIRTSVRLRGQIYSLLPLTTRPPLHEACHARTVRGWSSMARQARHVAAGAMGVNASERVPRRVVPVAPRCRSGAPDFNSPPNCQNVERV